MMKERLRKSIVRAVFIFLWGWLMHYFYIVEGQMVLCQDLVQVKMRFSSS